MMLKQFAKALVVQLAILLSLSASLYAAEATDYAQASFNYISSTLQAFRSSGNLVDNPGIDEADLEEFIDLLEDAYQNFSEDFNSESAMCRFYRDPENARMTIEERAELSALYLRSAEARVEMFAKADSEFLEGVEELFGSSVLDNINAAKVAAVSNQRLPSSTFDEAATISFLDAMCS